MNNPLSFSSVKLDLLSKEGVHLDPASGFVLEDRNQYYLITNRHVLSVSEQEGHVLEPHLLKISVHIHTGEDEKAFPFSMGMRRKITITLYDDNHMPRWIEGSADKLAQPIADIVALPIAPDETLRLFETIRLFSGKIMGSISKADYWSKVSSIPISAIDTDVEYGPSDPVHIVGYPLGWAPDGTERSSSAFWRTSFIASEIYEAGMSRSGAFFIDPRAPEGMTGSPVVGMKDNRMKLLGVYSDCSTAEFGANAGLVWGAWLLKELIGAS
jgi:hypothetical protein